MLCMETYVRGYVRANGRTEQILVEKVNDAFEALYTRYRDTPIHDAELVKITITPLQEMDIDPDWVSLDSKTTTYAIVAKNGDELAIFTNKTSALRMACAMIMIDSYLLPDKRAFALKETKTINLQKAFKSWVEARQAQIAKDEQIKVNLINDLKSAIDVLERSEPRVCRWIEARKAKHSLRHLIKAAKANDCVTPKEYLFIAGMSGRLL